MLSIIFQTRNNKDTIAEFHSRLVSACAAATEPFELIAVDQGSADGTLEILRTLTPLKTIAFLKDFGITSAYDAGIHASHGDAVVLIPPTLEIDPQEIPRAVSLLREGHDCVVGWRENRARPPARKIISSLANMLTRRVTGLPLRDFSCPLKVFKKEFMQDVHLYGDMHVFLPAILASRGARVTEMRIAEARERVRPQERYLRLSVHSLSDLFAVKFLFNYAARPLLFFGKYGTLSFLVGLVAASGAVYLKLAGIRNLMDTPLPILAALLAILGFILFAMGFIAELLVRVYYEGRNLLPYVAKDIIENGQGGEKADIDEGLY